MKKLVLISILINSLFLNSQEKPIAIGDLFFEFKKLNYVDSDNGSEKNVIEIKNINEINKKTILSHIIKEKGGDHNSESLELGDYEISGNYLTLYSFWCRRGDAPVSPYGARVLKYELRDSNFVLIEGKIYLEKTRISWEETIGIKFLFEDPKNEKERNQYAKYINQIEKEYNAKFVFGKKADSLLKKVKAKLKTKIYKETKDWYLIESPFGIKI